MEHREAIVQLSRTKGFSERQISKLLHIPPSTVHYWLIREGVAKPTKTGRPRVTDAIMDLDIYTESLNNPFKSAVDLQLEFAPHCSVDTVRKRLRERGLKCRIPARKPFLSNIHIEKRIRFAYDHLDWNIQQWHQVVFSDEKIFRSTSRGQLHVYRPIRGSDRFDSKYITRTTNPANRHTVAVWMAFGGNGQIRAIHRITRRTLNSEYYIEHILPIIEDDLVENNLIFMHDKSSIHKSRLTTHWLTHHNINFMNDWPPKGPDMNPVENVWAELVRRTRRNSTNRNQLWENILEAFLGLENNYFSTLVESMPTRMISVLNKRGGWTKY